MGAISLAAGLLGVFLPVLPTTPFILLSAWCFVRSSKEFYDYIVSNETFGPIVENYQNGGGITQKTRIRAVVMMWLTISVSAYFFVDSNHLIAFLYLTAIGVTVYLFRLPTVPE